MKIQRAPIILFAIAALLGSFVYFHEVRGATNREQAQSQAKKLFPFEEKDIQAFSIKTLLRTISFTKTSPQASSKPAWRMTAPKNTLANEGTIAYLLNLIGTGTSEKTITTPAAQAAEFGFDQPLATVDVTLTNQQTHRLVLGKPDFNRTYLYAQVDPPVQASDIMVHLVSLDFEKAIARQLPEWEAAEGSMPSSRVDNKPKR